MLPLTRATVALSLIVTPPEDKARDEITIVERISRLEDAQVEVRSLTLFWMAERGPEDGFIRFEERLCEALQKVGRASIELMLALAEQRSRRALPARFEVGGTLYRKTSPEPRSLATWYGTIRYGRSYARPVAGGAGWFPLDAELGLLGDRFSPSLLAIAARLATRVSYSEAHEMLGWFVPQPPSTEVMQQTVLGLGQFIADWFEAVDPPDDDGEVLVTLIDGKCVPTVREGELEKRRGPRKEKPKAASPRHRGRADRQARGARPRPKKGDKKKNGKLVTMVVMYTLRRDGDLLLGPLNRRVYASFGPKRHAFEFAVEEARRRGFGPGTEKTVHFLTDGDRDLHRYVDEYFSEESYPNRVVTVDVMHVMEKLWEAGRALHEEGSPELAAWVHIQETHLYSDEVDEVLTDLQSILDSTPKTGPGNKGKRERLSKAIRYLDERRDKLGYGSLRERDLEVGTGQVEGAIKYVIARRCDHGGMRWIRERAQAIVQLRCIDVNQQWTDFVLWSLKRLRAQARSTGTRIRLQTRTPAPLPSLQNAA